MKLPKTLYVRIEGDGADEYFTASETPAGGIDVEGERREVGVYELKEIVDIKWTKEVIATPKKRRR